MVSPPHLLVVTLFIIIMGRVGWCTPHDLEAWDSTMALIGLEDSKTYHLFVELQPRLGDDWQRMAAILVRAALVYRANPALSLFGGYAWFPTFYDSDYHRTYRDEQRLWQQALFTHELWHISWQHRLRQEQRWIEHTDGVVNRSRYLLRSTIPLTIDRRFGITAFDECMVNLNGVNGGPGRGYDRNRIFAGPYWEYGTAHFEVGYLGEHSKRFGDDARWVSALAVNTAVHF